jgi:hypothetical protein
MRFNLKAEELFEAAIAVRPLQPLGDSKGVLLVGRSSLVWECLVPERRINLSGHGATDGNTPTVADALGANVLCTRVMPCLLRGGDPAH